MRCYIRLKRKDGVVAPLPEECRDAMPKPGDVITVSIGGRLVQARVERIGRGHKVGPQSAVEAVHYINATEL